MPKSKKSSSKSKDAAAKPAKTANIPSAPVRVAAAKIANSIAAEAQTPGVVIWRQSAGADPIRIGSRSETEWKAMNETAGIPAAAELAAKLVATQKKQKDIRRGEILLLTRHGIVVFSAIV